MIFATVVIPAFNRQQTIGRAIGSVVGDSMVSGRDQWEIIVVDDASIDYTKKRIHKWTKRYPYNIICLPFKEHSERVIATNAAIRTARGDWIIRLDSDDELVEGFKESFGEAVRKYPEAKILNWGSTVKWPDGTETIREPFRPALKEDGTVEEFASGKICSGAFAFKKDLINRVGFLPEVRNPYALGEYMLNQYPEIRELYPEGKTDLGNPWGDDWALFYKLTRIEQPQSVNKTLHIIHVRA